MLDKDGPALRVAAVSLLTLGTERWQHHTSCSLCIPVEQEQLSLISRCSQLIPQLFQPSSRSGPRLLSPKSLVREVIVESHSVVGSLAA